MVGRVWAIGHHPVRVIRTWAGRADHQGSRQTGHPRAAHHRYPILVVLGWRQAASRRHAATTRGRTQGRLLHSPKGVPSTWPVPAPRYGCALRGHAVAEDTIEVDQRPAATARCSANADAISAGLRHPDDRCWWALAAAVPRFRPVPEERSYCSAAATWTSRNASRWKAPGSCRCPSARTRARIRPGAGPSPDTLAGRVGRVHLQSQPVIVPRSITPWCGVISRCG